MEITDGPSGSGSSTTWSNYADKSVVLQEARTFHATPIHARACRLILAKVIYGLVMNGTGAYTRLEATDVFFGVTKLFQCPDMSLRQMVYLAIKELSTSADDVIMVTSSLTKDLIAKVGGAGSSSLSSSSGHNASSAFAAFLGAASGSTHGSNSSLAGGTEGGAGMNDYRASAIRALCKITDPSMLPAIERFIKQSIIDKNPALASAALVSSYHMFAHASATGATGASDVIKRSVNEVQECVNSKFPMVQYHAFGLLYTLKASDKMAVLKILSNHQKIKSPFALVTLVRILGAFISRHPHHARSGAGLAISDPLTVYGQEYANVLSFLDILVNHLRYKHDMVVLESAKTILTIPNVDLKYVAPAVSVLQMFLVSPKAVLRFSATRLLHNLALVNPTLVIPCNVDLEGLVADTNSNVATFAITTLLKTGNEESVDRLMTQISKFMSSISEEFKCVVVDAVGALTLKFPGKHAIFLNFLAGLLRDEGKFDYKSSLIQALINVVYNVPEALEIAMGHLCEFVEDCEFNKLGVRIIHLLGDYGPSCPNPKKYIPTLYNRVILENAQLRAAAVSALGRIAVALPSLAPQILSLIKKVVNDADDEVRDRAIFYVKLLSTISKADVVYLPPNMEIPPLPSKQDFSPEVLESALLEYLQQPDHTTAFDMKSVPLVAVSAPSKGVAPNSLPAAPMTIPGTSTGFGLMHANTAPIAQEQISQLPASFGAFGDLLKTCNAVQLTEAETEYVVVLNKLVYKDHLVLQFTCTNTLPDSLLENVTVSLSQTAGDAVTPESVIPIPALPPSSDPASTFVVLSRKGGSLAGTAFSCTLQFTIKDCNPATGVPDDDEGFEDEYLIEDFSIESADFIGPWIISDFNGAWSSLPASSEAVETFGLALRSLEDGVKHVIHTLGMTPLTSTNLKPTDTLTTLYLAGTLLEEAITSSGSNRVLARVKMAFDSEDGVTLQLTLRNGSGRAEVSQRLLQAFE